MKWIQVVVIVLFVCSVPASADIIDPNRGNDNGPARDQYVTIQHCYRIENADQYPGYTFGFFALPHPGGGFEALEDHPCYGHVYHLAMARVAVMDRGRYQALAHNTSGYLHDPSVLTSDYLAPTTASARRTEKILSHTDVLTVTTLNATYLGVKKIRTYNTYSDGHTEDVPVTTLTTAPAGQPSRTPPPPAGETPLPPTAVSIPATDSPGGFGRSTPVASPQDTLLPLTAGSMIIAVLTGRRRP